jgi:mRNA interferase MazF
LVAGNRYIPERGDVVWLDLDPRAGHEQAGRRPAIVVSPGSYNGKVGLALFCPITSRVKGYPFEVALPEGFLVQGVVLADQLRSMDWRARGARRIAAAPVGVVEAVLARVRALVVG